MISSRGFTMTKVAHLRQTLHQICADEHVPDSMTARIMAENGVTTTDVMDAMDVLQDVVIARREAENRAATQ